MKKFLAITLSILAIVSAFSVVSLAETKPFEADYAGENDIVLASLNGVKPFIGDLANLSSLEEACYWLTDFSKQHGLKYVSFTGNIASGSTYTYDNYCVPQGKTQQEMVDANLTDKRALKEYNALKSTGSILTDENIPYGVSIHRNDYISYGFTRANFISSNFLISDFVGKADVKTISLDPNNFALIIPNGNSYFIVYQLEAYPLPDTISWFNELNKKHPDKRAFIFTTSFTDKNGEMFTAYDPTIYKYYNTPFKGNSNLTTAMANAGFYDGDKLWQYSFEQFDNIVMVMSANAEPGKAIVTNKHKNSRGYEVVSVVANLIGGYATEGAYPIMINFSEEDKTLDLRYAVPYDNKVGGYVEESRVTVALDNLAPLPDPAPVSMLPKVPVQSNGSNNAYINGYAGNVFKPNANMTKAEASIIFARLLEGSQTIPSGYTTRFTDVKEGDWFYNAIAYLDSKGFYYTNTSDKYNPNTPITRAEFVELAYFASELEASDAIAFTDVPESHKYYDAIIAAAASGLVNGYEDNTFRPDATITRAEVVTIINRMLTLVSNDHTISKDILTNIFTDINGHWAEYQILMSSNNNVKSIFHAKSDPTIYKETPTAITFENKHIRIGISKKDAKIVEATYLPTGESVLQGGDFSYLENEAGAKLNATKAELIDGRIKVTYKGGDTAYFIVEIEDNYFTITLDSNVNKAMKKLVFGHIDFNYTYSENDPESFRASCVLMDTRAGREHYLGNPGGYNTFVNANVNPGIGVDTIGTKIGITFSREKEHRDFLKEIVEAVDTKFGIKSNHGGPYTYDCPDLYEDYAIVQSGRITNDNVEELAKTLKKYSINQIDILFGPGFINIDPKEYKKNVIDVFHANGIQAGLHTYSSCLTYTADKILSNPKWYSMIDYDETLDVTLRGDLNATKDSVKTSIDATQIGLNKANSTKYILIDNEIIKVDKASTSGFIKVERGACGTTPAPHKNGTPIIFLQGKYNSFQPMPGTELFYYMAKETARIYNEAGFDMIYLDGFETFGGLGGPNTDYYHYAEFYRTVLNDCIKKPIIEDSASAAVWAGRGRGGAVDSVHRGVKKRTLSLFKGHENLRRQYYTATIGWFIFDTDEGEQFKNLYNKTLFHDDLDAIGSLALAYNYSNVDNAFSLNNVNSQSRHSHNLMYYSVYSRLRKSGYFSPEVTEQIRTGKYEYRVFKKADGDWAFREMKYVYNRTYDLSNSLYNTGKAVNPFGEQTPFIRIEQRYSTLSQNELLLLEVDENAEVSTLIGTKNVAAINMNDTKAVKVKVLGNGSETGGVCISISNSNGTYGTTVHTDYYIPTAHTGWKEFILVECENGDHPGEDFKELDESGNSWRSLTPVTPFNGINRISILAHGDVAGVKLDDIKAYTMVDAPAKNPSVTIGGNTITFNTEIKSGEFIEYYPDTNKAYLNYYVVNYESEGTYDGYDANLENSDKKFAGIDCYAKEITFSGSVKVPSGSFSYTYNAEATTNAPLRAEVTIGLQGAVIENPDGWVAPQVDMGEATLDPLYDLQ